MMRLLGHSSIRDPTSLQLEFPVSLKDARARVYL